MSALLLVGRESDRVIQAECEDGFGWNVHLLALGENFGSRSPGGANRGSDGCALTVTNDCTNNCAYQGAAADHFRRALVHSQSMPAAPTQGRGADAIPPAVDSNGLNVERHVITRRKSSNDELSGRSPGDYDFAGIFGDVLITLPGIDLIGVGGVRIDLLICQNGEPSPCRKIFWLVVAARRVSVVAVVVVAVVSVVRAVVVSVVRVVVVPIVTGILTILVIPDRPAGRRQLERLDLAGAVGTRSSLVVPESNSGGISRHHYAGNGGSVEQG